MSVALVPPPDDSDPGFGLIDPLLANLRTLGRYLDDIEAARIANGNRIGALDRRALDPLPGLVAIHAQVENVEHLIELELCRMWRTHELAPWAKNIRGLGEKSIARLIAEIGHPSIAVLGVWQKLPYGDREWVPTGTRPRTVSQLWSYCGLGDPARRRVKGMLAEELMALGKPRAKKQLHLIAVSFVKQGIRYREVYDGRKAANVGREHAEACVRCGPSGKPAAAGSLWSDMHRHFDALRITEKTFLKDLWVASRLTADESHISNAGGVPE